MYYLFYVCCNGHNFLCTEVQRGVQAGLVGSQVEGDNYWGYNKAGFYGGVYSNRRLNDRASFQLEFNYIQKGSHQNPNAGWVSG